MPAAGLASVLAGVAVVDAVVVASGFAAVSVGVVKGEPVLDLCYEEDATAEVDFNVVMTGAGEFIEVQGTAEGKPFSRATLDELLQLAHDGILQLFEFQTGALAEAKLRLQA